VHEVGDTPRRLLVVGTRDELVAGASEPGGGGREGVRVDCFDAEVDSVVGRPVGHDDALHLAVVAPSVCAVGGRWAGCEADHLAEEGGDGGAVDDLDAEVAKLESVLHGGVLQGCGAGGRARPTRRFADGADALDSALERTGRRRHVRLPPVGERAGRTARRRR
jgi:hypothetical protein